MGEYDFSTNYKSIIPNFGDKSSIPTFGDIISELPIKFDNGKPQIPSDIGKLKKELFDLGKNLSIDFLKDNTGVDINPETGEFSTPKVYDTEVSANIKDKTGNLKGDNFLFGINKDGVIEGSYSNKGINTTVIRRESGGEISLNRGNQNISITRNNDNTSITASNGKIKVSANKGSDGSGITAEYNNGKTKIGAQAKSDGTLGANIRTDGFNGSINRDANGNLSLQADAQICKNGSFTVSRHSTGEITAVFLGKWEF